MLSTKGGVISVISCSIYSIDLKLDSGPWGGYFLFILDDKLYIYMLPIASQTTEPIELKFCIDTPRVAGECYAIKNS